MSKNQKKKKCQYVFKKGQQKGEKCNNYCRGTYCKFHNKNRLEYMKNYNDQRNENNEEKKLQQKLKNIKNGECEIPNLTTYKRKIKELENLRTEYHAIAYGCKIRIDPDWPIPIKPKIRKELDSEDFLEECKEIYDDLVDESKETYGSFENFLNRRKQFMLTMPNTYCKYIPFNGSVYAAEKKFNELCKEEQICLKKINKLITFINRVEKIIERKNII